MTSSPRGPKSTTLSAVDAQAQTERSLRIQQARQRAAETRRQAKRKKENQRGRRKSGKYYQETCLPAIAEAVAQGQSKVSITLSRGKESELSAELNGLAQGTLDRLERGGFVARLNSSRFEAHWDDAMGDEYSHSLDISWKKS